MLKHLVTRGFALAEPARAQFRHYLNPAGRAQRPDKLRSLFFEHLEARAVPSTITWTNRGNDAFDAVFGADANLARSDVDAALADWAVIISNFNYGNGTNNLNVSIDMAGPGFGAAASVSGQINGRPNQGAIGIDSGQIGLPDRGWYLCCGPTQPVFRNNVPRVSARPADSRP
jgi:hypothetical protein